MTIIKHNEWEKRFDDKFVRDDGLMDKYSYLDNGDECVMADAIKEFIKDEKKKWVEEVESEVNQLETFIEIPNKGVVKEDGGPLIFMIDVLKLLDKLRTPTKGA